MRVFKLTCASLVVLGYFAACGSPTLPSTTPLGGHEDPDAGPDASSDGSSDADAKSAPSAKPKASSAPPKPTAAPSAPPSAAPAPSTPSAPPDDAGAVDAAPAAKAPKCDDSGGDENACSNLPAPTGASMCPAAFVAPMLCKQLAKVLKPKVTEALASCFTQKINANQCNPEDVKPCAFEAISVACVKKAYKKTCEGILSACPNPRDEDERELFKQSTCEQGIASLRDTYRKPFTDCVKRECDIGKCMGEALGDDK